MNKENRILEVVLLAYLLVFGTLLLYAKADYWSLVDWFAYPALDAHFIATHLYHGFGIILLALPLIKGVTPERGTRY